MKKYFFAITIFIMCYYNANGQIFMTRSGFIGFYSKTAFEDIKAENNQVFALIDNDRKSIALMLLIKSFLFPKELMQEHFNENYAESDKFPKASFAGTYTGDLILNRDGKYTVTINGRLTFHGITKEIEAAATFEIIGRKLTGHSLFKIKPEDFNIKIPSVVRDKIAKDVTVEVQIDCNNIK